MACDSEDKAPVGKGLCGTSSLPCPALPCLCGRAEPTSHSQTEAPGRAGLISSRLPQLSSVHSARLTSTLPPSPPPPGFLSIVPVRAVGSRQQAAHSHGRELVVVDSSRRKLSSRSHPPRHTAPFAIPTSQSSLGLTKATWSVFGGGGIHFYSFFAAATASKAQGRAGQLGSLSTCVFQHSAEAG